MATRKHLLLIHGRATKPSREEKTRLVREALLSRLRTERPRAAKAIETDAVGLTLAYYGDVNNALMVKAEPERAQQMVKRPNPDAPLDAAPYDGLLYFEPDGSYDADLARLVARERGAHGKADYQALLDAVPDKHLYDDAARVLSALGSVFGFGGSLLRKHTPDLWAYLTTRKAGSMIRQRLQAPLADALRAGEEVAVVAHSMGCIVSYDVLWKFSHMSEYAEFHQRSVSLWLTLGCPLGEPAVAEALYDVREGDDGKYPRLVERWLNVAAHDDFVAHDGSVADDFGEMRRRAYVRELRDLERIYTFWTGSEGSNPHKFYGYLNHPTVAGAIGDWIES